MVFMHFAYKMDLEKENQKLKRRCVWTNNTQRPVYVTQLYMQFLHLQNQNLIKCTNIIKKQQSLSPMQFWVVCFMHP